MSHAKTWYILVPCVLLVLLLAALLGVAEARRTVPLDPEIRRVVVIHLDTTRADDLSCNGGIPRTPNIDQVAARGMRYTNSIAPLPKTSPSVASFMTGRLANRHGVYTIGGKLQDKYTTLAEVLRDHGFVTGGFSSNPVVDKVGQDKEKSAGFDQGFDVFKAIRDLPDVPEGAEANAVPRALCETLVQEAMAFVDENRNDKFFLWMLNLDPHAPYAPPAPYDTLYTNHPEVRAGSVKLRPEVIHNQAYVSWRLDSHEYVARHMGEVTLTDFWIGKLLRKIRQLPGKTLLVITADHGESLGDANYWFGHGRNIRHPCVNVPLIIACDGIVPVGESDALVANVDVAPTILGLLGVPGDPLGADGRSLQPTFDRQDPWPGRLVPLQTYYGNNWRGIRSSRFCLQSLLDPKSGRRLQSLLYHIADDPTETSDVSTDFPDVLSVLLEAEESWFVRGERPAEEVHLRHEPEMIRRLKSLGYMQ